MRYVILVLLVIVSVVHLGGRLIPERISRIPTKPFLLILILLYYLFSTKDYSWLLIAALAASWLGDVLLMKSGNKWFTAGGISFMAAHFFFIGVYAFNIDFHSINFFVVIPASVAYFTVSALVMHSIRNNTPKSMVVPMLFYLCCNSAMNVFALIQLETGRSLGAAFAFAGAVLFFISDCTLFLVRYHKNKYIFFKRHFTVMLTYILGEFFITQGVLMIG